MSGPSSLSKAHVPSASARHDPPSEEWSVISRSRALMREPPSTEPHRPWRHLENCSGSLFTYLGHVLDARTTHDSDVLNVISALVSALRRITQQGGKSQRDDARPNHDPGPSRTSIAVTRTQFHMSRSPSWLARSGRLLGRPGSIPRGGKRVKKTSRLEIR